MNLTHIISVQSGPYLEQLIVEILYEHEHGIPKYKVLFVVKTFYVQNSCLNVGPGGSEPPITQVC